MKLKPNMHYVILSFNLNVVLGMNIGYENHTQIKVVL